MYFARLLESMMHSSWMVIIVVIPVLSAFAVAYHAGPLYLLVSLLTLASYLVLPAVLGAAITLVVRIATGSAPSAM